MKFGFLAAGLAAALATAAIAQDAEDPFADAVESRHGLMLLMAQNLGTLGGMAKGETPYDSAVAGKAADNIAALASVLSMDLFPAGSEYGKAADSFSLPSIWTDQANFVAKINALNEAANAMTADAKKDLASLQAGMNSIGGACAACHKAYRQPEE